MLQQETIDLMAENCVSLVTTLNISLNVANFPGLHPAVAKKLSYAPKLILKQLIWQEKQVFALLLVQITVIQKHSIC